MDKSKSVWFRAIEFLLGAGGVILLVWMMQKIGFATLKQNLFSFGISPTLFLILIYSLAQFAFCAGWFVLLNIKEKTLTFWETFLAYAAGDALNMTVPSANLAGEPVKVMLIRDKISFESAISSVTVYKYSDFVSLTLFLLVGWLSQFGFYSLPLSWNIGAGIVAGGMSIFCIFLYILQHRGIYHPTGRLLSKIGFAKWIVNKLESAHLIDKEILNFYQTHPSKFFLSLFFNFFAWFGGVIEIVLFMAISGVPVSFAAALTIETFSLFINNVIFFVPARLGVGEGGRVLLFMTLGYPPSIGMTYGIIRRIRESVWIAFGVAILLFRKKVSKPFPSS